MEQIQLDLIYELLRLYSIEEKKYSKENFLERFFTVID